MKSIFLLLPVIAFLLLPFVAKASNLVRNGSFNDTSAYWFTNCNNVEADYLEPTYGGANVLNHVAEIDDLTCTYQDICILPGATYALSLLASRRTNAGALIATNIKVEGLNATGNVVGVPLVDFTFSRDNTLFALTPVPGIPLIQVPAATGIVRLRIRFTDDTPGYAAMGMIIDEVSLVFQPQPQHTGDTATCISRLTTHAVTNLPAGTLYHWDFDGGAPATSTAVAPGVLWSTNGTKVISCVISNPVCPVDTITQTVTVGDPAVPAVVSPIQYCTGDTAAALTAAGTDLVWYTTAAGGTGTAIAPAPPTATAGTTTWYVSRMEGVCESPRVPLSVIVHNNVTAHFDYVTHYGCSADTLVFTNLSTGNGSYTWDFGDYTQSLMSQPIHVYGAQGIYTVKLLSTGGYCNDSLSQVIDLRHPLAAGFIADSSMVCEGGVIHFADTSVATTSGNTGPSRLWDFGDGTADTAFQPAHHYALPGAYRVVLHVTDFVPCTDTAAIWVYVDSAAALELIHSDTALCTGETFYVDGLYTQAGLTGFHCDFGEGTAAYSGSPAQHAYDAPGVYTVIAKAAYRACPEAMQTVQVRVKPMPVLQLGDDTSICLNGAAVFLSDRVNAANPLAHWHWSNGDTLAGIKITAPGRYTGTVTIEGCSTSDEVVVRKDCYIDVPNAFTPDGDGYNDYFFPRQLLSAAVFSFHMQVFNRWGQLVFETDKPDGRGWDGRLHSTAQPAGVYLYRLDVAFQNGASEQYTGNVTLLR